VAQAGVPVVSPVIEGARRVLLAHSGAVVGEAAS
jgi:hypothetical protein